MPVKKRRVLSSGQRRLKKTIVLDQNLLDRARAALGERTETETITRALEDTVRRAEQIDGIRALTRMGPIDPRRIS